MPMHMFKNDKMNLKGTRGCDQHRIVLEFQSADRIATMTHFIFVRCVPVERELCSKFPRKVRQVPPSSDKRKKKSRRYTRWIHCVSWLSGIRTINLLREIVIHFTENVKHSIFHACNQP